MRPARLLSIVLGFAVLMCAKYLPAQNVNAPETKDALQVGTVTEVVEHPAGRIFAWNSLVPIYDNYPYYDITIQTPEHKYVTRYESPSGYYPAGWQVGKELKFRHDKGQLMLLRYDGELIPARIIH